jgi:hypothetical protein
MNALNTPLASYEMTNIDKEMSDVLSRTDIPADQRLKLYFTLLDKYKHVHNVYSASQPKSHQILKSKETEHQEIKDVVKGAVKEYLKDVNETDDTFASIDDDDDDLKVIHESTPTSSSDKHSSGSKSLPIIDLVDDDKNKTMLDETVDVIDDDDTYILDELSGPVRFSDDVILNE